MNDDHSLANLRRGILLINQERYDDAEKYLGAAIAAEPENHLAHAHLAFCLLNMEGRRGEALNCIEEAIRLYPEESDYHAGKSEILATLRRGKEALASADHAIALDPSSATAYAAKAGAFLVVGNWSAAEEEARRALSLNPDDSTAANILATALRLQGKTRESSDAARSLLRENPEDPYSHSNAGWAALQSHDYQLADRHFREALRLDAELEYAREGLLESFRARSNLYRLYLRYAFFMQRFQGKTQWAIIIGLYLGFRFGRKALTALHPLAGAAVGIVYALLVFWVWVAEGVGNLVILLDRTARLALRGSEKLEAVFVGAGFTAGMAGVIAGVASGATPLTVLGAGAAVAAIPASLTFTNPSPVGSKLFGAVTAAIYLTSIANAAALLWFQESAWAETAAAFFGFALLAGFFSTWVGNIPGLRAARVR